MRWVQRTSDIKKKTRCYEIIKWQTFIEKYGILLYQPGIGKQIDNAVPNYSKYSNAQQKVQITSVSAENEKLNCDQTKYKNRTNNYNKYQMQVVKI